MQNKSPQKTDIVIVGAGMAGCLLALAIAKRSPNTDILLIDDNPERVEKGRHPGFDARSIALSAGSCQLLDELGIWSALAINAQPIEDIHISDRGNLAIAELHNETPSQPYGYVVELQDAGVVIQQQLALYPQIKRLYDCQLIALTKQQQHVLCETHDEQMIQAKLCVSADGAQSNSRALLSIASSHYDYHCAAIIANVSCDKPHQNRAFERFTDAGPLALLPLTDNRYSLVWSVHEDQLEQLLALDDVDFLATLQQAFGYRAGIFTRVGRCDSYPLALTKTEKAITHRGVAIGNAAHCLHPVMGQGFNLAMRDLSTLATVIGQLQTRDALGSYTMLNRYWQAREQDHHNTINMTDAMVRIFSSRELPMMAGRTLALQAIALFPGLAKPIVKQAKGQFNLFEKEDK